MIIFLTIAVICYGVAGAIVFLRLRDLRAGKVTLADLQQPSFRLWLSNTLDAFAVSIVFLSRELAHHSYVYLLVIAKRLVSLAKRVSIKIERVLGQVIHTTRERKRSDRERGSSSLFLREMKIHQAEVKRTLQSFSRH